jgi:hypothetical protein
MSDASHVTMEQKQCFVCGTVFDTGAILLDKKLRKAFRNSKTVTGFGVCPEHNTQLEGGYVILIGATEGTLSTEPKRTGDIISIREEVFKRIFDVEVPEKRICFISPEVIVKIKEMANAEDHLSPHTEPAEPTGPSGDTSD